MEKKISISQIKEVAQEAYNEVKGSTGGKNADYIPYLANIDSKLFGLSICLMNGQTINIGDTDYRFGIESVSKVHSHPYPAPIRCAESAGHDRCRCHGTTVQLHHRHLAGKRPPFHSIGKCRCHFRLFHGTASGKLRQEMGCHCTECH